MAVQDNFTALTSVTSRVRSSTKKWQTPDRFILGCSAPRTLASRNIAMVATPGVASAFGAFSRCAGWGLTGRRWTDRVYVQSRGAGDAKAPHRKRVADDV